MILTVIPKFLSLPTSCRKYFFKNLMNGFLALPKWTVVLLDHFRHVSCELMSSALRLKWPAQGLAFYSVRWPPAVTIIIYNKQGWFEYDLRGLQNHARSVCSDRNCGTFPLVSEYWLNILLNRVLSNHRRMGKFKFEVSLSSLNDIWKPIISVLSNRDYFRWLSSSEWKSSCYRCNSLRREPRDKWQNVTLQPSGIKYGD